MNLSGLTTFIQGTSAFSQLIEDIEATPTAPIRLGLLRAAWPVVTAALHRATQRPLIVVTTHSADAWQMAEQLHYWMDDTGVVQRYPEPDVLAYERMPWATETRQQRVSALAALMSAHRQEGLSPIIVTSIRAVLRKTLPPREFLLGVRSLRVDQTINLNNLLAYWYAFGYEPVEVVEEPGQYSRRGGIIDVFSPQWGLPVRIELFGDNIDSLRTFDPKTQRSTERLEAVTLLPAREALPKFGPAARKKFAALDFSSCQTAARNEFERDMESLEQSEVFQNLEFYIPYLYSQTATLLDYLPGNSLLVLDDLTQIKARVRELSEQTDAMRAAMHSAGELPSGALTPYAAWEDVQDVLERPNTLSFGYGGFEAPHPLGEMFGVSPRYGAQLRELLGEWLERSNTGRREVVVSRQASRLADLLSENGMPTGPVQRIDTPPPPDSITLVQGALPEGWTIHRAGDALQPDLVLLSDAEIFGLSKPEPRRPKPTKLISPEAFFADVSPEDYVVHIEHGIGLYRGLVKMVHEGIEQEYLRIDYAEGDRLYVPVYQADRLSRYMAGGDIMPPIHRLGGGDWERAKAKARHAVEDIAEDLLELYAARHVVEGHAFAPDTTWQYELESSFPYVETQDQLEAIDAVKRDMEAPRPMDRLVTGDVGYGKTEVALRAAFKAVTDNRQVALLVPTTVLAQQHFQTFRDRLAAFPVEIEMLSRFRSQREQLDILERLAKGRIDIVIGTHRLIQKDVHFKDLGLLIIDEEQRFGVAHKERLKQMRKEVDVLTLTATPIPRTLYMSLTGARDMSTIDTPPEERLPIKTRVAEYDDNLVRQAILRELNRGGQVYFVHNRVRGIEQIAQRVQKLVPEARTAIGHGQMREPDLEQVMMDFAAGHIDVLVCTSIVESGLDIPNANTIIINRADQFGLAQLYQLRGRVGRSTVRAYAYLLYPPHQPLSEVALRRLEAIAKASELGAGFQVAMFDLEIRGAGEFLGRRQHGHIAAVGFDLYTRLLAQAVQRIKEERETGAYAPQPDRLPSAGVSGRPADVVAHLLEPLGATVQINLPLAAYLPADYVPQEELRLQLYRRMAELRSEEQIAEMRRELEDRFGPLPKEADLLFYQLGLKTLAVEAEVDSIVTDSGQVVVRCREISPVSRQHLRRKIDGGVRVERRSIWLAMDDAWPEKLEAVLKAIVDSRRIIQQAPVVI